METNRSNGIIPPPLSAPAHEPLAGPDTPGFKTRSAAAQDMLETRHGFLERWGLIIFLLVLLLLATCTWFIQYPDIIKANALLTATNAPKEIIARSEGRLIRLMAVNDQQVQAGQIIGILESTADYREALSLKNQIDTGILRMQENHPEKAAALFARTYKDLGELQVPYQQFISQWQQFNDYLSNGFYHRKKNMLEQDIHAMTTLNENIRQQEGITRQDVALSKESYDMNRQLLEYKVISKDEMRAQESRFLNKQLSLPALEASRISNNNQLREKQKEILQLDHDMRQQHIIFEQALQTLKSLTDDWIKKYVLIAPVTGKIAMAGFLQENQVIRMNRTICYVNPGDVRYYAEVTLPQTNAGKLDTGLQVQLRFQAYPHEEFGHIDGKLGYISKVATDSGFLATVVLENGLETTRHRQLQFRNGLKAEAIIITRNYRLLQRLYYNLIKETSPGR